MDDVLGGFALSLLEKMRVVETVPPVGVEKEGSEKIGAQNFPVVVAADWSKEEI